MFKFLAGIFTGWTLIVWGLAKVVGYKKFRQIISEGFYEAVRVWNETPVETAARDLSRRTRSPGPYASYGRKLRDEREARLRQGRGFAGFVVDEDDDQSPSRD